MQRAGLDWGQLLGSVVPLEEGGIIEGRLPAIVASHLWNCQFPSYAGDLESSRPGCEPSAGVLCTTVIRRRLHCLEGLERCATDGSWSVVILTVREISLIGREIV